MSDLRSQRLAALAAVDSATTFDAEQAAQTACLVVDILPSLPDGCADLHHRWSERDYPDHTMEYVACVKSLGAAFDKGARRYVIRSSEARRVYEALRAEGFLAALHTSLA